MLDRKYSRLYNSLNNGDKREVNRFIVSSFMTEKRMDEIVKIYIDDAIVAEQDKKDADPICYMYLRMLNKVINGPEKYVKHMSEVSMEVENEYFNHPASKLCIVFDDLNHDICSKSTLSNGENVLISLLTSSTINPSDYEGKSRVYVLELDKLCGDKVFSRDSIRELDGMINYIMKRQVPFYLDLITKPSDDIKKIIK